MKVALIGDIHANLPALEAVVTDARARGAGDFWNIGDFVGYGAFADAVVCRVRDLGAVSVIGNYDLKVLAFPDHDEEWRRTKKPEKHRSFEWAWHDLSADSRAYLGSLPQAQRLDIGGVSALLTHGSPASIDEHLFPQSPDDRMDELAAMAASDLVVIGHSHQPFVRRVGACTFINTGSVGRADDGDPRASYATLEVIDGVARIEHFRIEYDVDAAVDAIRAHDLPEAFAQMMIHGRKLGWVLANVGGPRYLRRRGGCGRRAASRTRRCCSGGH